MHSKTEKNQNNYSTFLTFKLNFMKRPTKLLTALLALFIAFPSLKAGNMQVYTAGDLPTSAGTFVAPDFFGGAGWSYRSRTMDPAKKDTAFFPNVLGVTDGVAYGIEISKTQDDPGNIFLSLNLHSCDSIGGMVMFKLLIFSMVNLVNAEPCIKLYIWSMFKPEIK
jgi:hypothetical protein